MLSLKNLFRRTTARLSPTRLFTEHTAEDGYGWRLNTVPPGHGPTDMPPSMRMWKADQSTDRDRGLFEELNRTQRIPRIVPQGPETAFIAMSRNDVDARCTAARVLRGTRSVETVLAGLVQYAQRHPVAA